MRTPKELPKGTLESLAMGLQQAKTKAEFQSVQCLSFSSFSEAFCGPGSPHRHQLAS